ncbi:MAG: helix-turn-helix domain-containing protein [Anaeromyxobacter sp.]|nr:helix-turn-helix domain-containing protein [Anaeromyxobacter sp.]MBL0276121.1 helix-turn-helix domain-containing protein [Anaeromyxobacter sp.]
MSTAPEPAAPLLPAFGRWLKQERELRDMLPEEIAASTKLAPAVIEALESGEEARMPPRAYVVGYLRSYAAAVGLDADEVVLRWQEAAGEAPEVATRRGRRRLVPVLVAAAVLGVVAAMVIGALLR